MRDDLVIHVTTPDGVRHTLPALAGWRVMEIIKDAGLPIVGECGGACACATCHVVVDHDWRGKIIPARDDENEKLDDLWDRKDGSRLSCQIIMADELNGLSVMLV